MTRTLTFDHTHLTLFSTLPSETQACDSNMSNQFLLQGLCMRDFLSHECEVYSSTPLLLGWPFLNISVLYPNVTSSEKPPGLLQHIALFYFNHMHHYLYLFIYPLSLCITSPTTRRKSHEGSILIWPVYHSIKNVRCSKRAYMLNEQGDIC